MGNSYLDHNRALEFPTVGAEESFAVTLHNLDCLAPKKGVVLSGAISISRLMESAKL